MAGKYGWWTEASCKSDCRRFRAQESLKFEGKERGRRGGSVLPITCAGNAPWQLESAREEVAAVWQTTIFFSLKSGGGHDLVLRRLTGWRASSCSWPAAKSRACPVLVLYVIGNGVRPRAFLFHDERTRTSAAWSRTRGEETPMIGSHGVVRIFTHKHGQYANY